MVTEMANLKKESDAAKTESQLLKNQLMEAKNNERKLSHELKSITSLHDSISGEKADILNNFNVMILDFEDQKKRLFTLQQKLSQYEIQHKIMDELFAEKNTLLDQLKKDQDTMLHNGGYLKYQLMDARNELHRKEREWQILKYQLLSSVKTLKLNSELDNIKESLFQNEQLLNSEILNNNSLKQSLSSEREQLYNTLSEKKVLEERIIALQNELDIIKSSETLDINSLKQSLSSEREKLNNTLSEKKVLEERITALQNELDIIKNSEKQSVNNEVQNELFSNSISHILEKYECKSLEELVYNIYNSLLSSEDLTKNLMLEIECLKISIDGEREKNTVLISACNDAKDKVAVLQSERKSFENHIAVLNQENQVISSKDREIAALKRNLDLQTFQYKSLTQAYSAEQEFKRILSSEKEFLETKLVNTNAQKDSEIKRLQDSLDLLQSQNQALADSLETEHAKFLSLLNDKDNKLSDITTENLKDYGKFQQLQKAFEMEVSKNSSLMETLTAELESVKKFKQESENLRLELEKAQDQNNILKSKEFEIRQLKKDLEYETTQKQHFSNTLHSEQKMIQSLLSELESIASKRDSIINENNELKRSLELEISKFSSLESSLNLEREINLKLKLDKKQILEKKMILSSQLQKLQDEYEVCTRQLSVYSERLKNLQLSLDEEKNQFESHVKNLNIQLNTSSQEFQEICMSLDEIKSNHIVEKAQWASDKNNLLHEISKLKGDRDSAVCHAQLLKQSTEKMIQNFSTRKHKLDELANSVSTISTETVAKSLTIDKFTQTELKISTYDHSTQCNFSSQISPETINPLSAEKVLPLATENSSTQTIDVLKINAFSQYTASSVCDRGTQSIPRVQLDFFSQTIDSYPTITQSICTQTDQIFMKDSATSSLTLDTLPPEHESQIEKRNISRKETNTENIWIDNIPLKQNDHTIIKEHVSETFLFIEDDE